MSGEALPAVTVPPSSRKDGLSPAITSREVSGRTDSSAATRTGPPLRRGIPTGAISASNRPSACAFAAFWWLCSANSSCCARLIPCLSAMSSADSPSGIVHWGSILGFTMRQPSVVEYNSACPAGNGRSFLGKT